METRQVWWWCAAILISGLTGVQGQVSTPPTPTTTSAAFNPNPTTATTTTTTKTIPQGAEPTTTTAAGAGTGTTPSTEFPLIPVVAGAAGGVIFILVIILIALICKKMRRKPPEPQQQQLQETLDTPTEQAARQGSSLKRKKDKRLSNQSTKPSRPTSGYDNKAMDKRLPIEDLKAYVKGVMTSIDRYAEVTEEFHNIHMGQRLKWESGKRQGLTIKNRFKNIIAYDHSRVVLSMDGKNPLSDYINASYIDGYEKEKAFIATQGPTEDTVDDFWRMMWETKSSLVIMITNLQEGYRQKCHKYWPDNTEKQEMGPLLLQNVEEEIWPDYTIRMFKLSKKGETDRLVKQYHYTTWPDHDVPHNPMAVVKLRNKVKVESEADGSPIVIHCSAGVGRTGTFMAIDILLDMAEKEGVVDVFSCVNKMRDQRVSIVQTLEQYTFIYTALLEALTVGHTTIACSDFKDEYKKLVATNSATATSKLQEQFNLIDLMHSEVPEAYQETGKKSDNTSKNRAADILPDDRVRIMLTTPVKNRNFYINAVAVDGYRRRRAFLATQWPLEGTVIDFWRMVYEFNSRSIIVLATPGQAPDAPCYWPEDINPEEDQVLTYEFCDVTHQRTIQDGDITIRRMVLKAPNDTDNDVQKIRQFCVQKDLDSMSEEDAIETIINIYEKVQKHQQNTENQPTVVHCILGTKWTGIYCALETLFDMINAEQEVDVYLTARQIRNSRPQFINTVEQYRFLYVAAEKYMKKFETYANFQ